MKLFKRNSSNHFSDRLAFYIAHGLCWLQKSFGKIMMRLISNLNQKSQKVVFLILLISGSIYCGLLSLGKIRTNISRPHSIITNSDSSVNADSLQHLEFIYKSYLKTKKDAD